MKRKEKNQFNFRSKNEKGKRVAATMKCQQFFEFMRMASCVAISRRQFNRIESNKNRFRNIKSQAKVCVIEDIKTNV